MTKFEIGDRVKAKEGIPHRSIRKDDVYTVARESVGFLTFEGADDVSFNAGLFELYAKAGEFAAGDVVIAVSSESSGPQIGKLYTVESTYAAYDGSPMVRVVGGIGMYARQFRLATPEEIAASARCSVKVGNGGAQSYILTTDGGLSTVISPPGREVPAAGFDFSTIKAGDVIAVHYVVEGRRGGSLLGRLKPGYGDQWQFLLSDVVSVIPAPKPKTLRERAIEAAKHALTHAGAENMVGSVVDAVLAEVEKG